MLGVILGLILVTMLAVAFLLWRRRRIIWASSQGPRPTDESGMRILNWMRGQEAKSPTAATSEDVSGPPLSDTLSEGDPSSPGPATPDIAVSGPHHEMENTGIAELMDTSPRVELQDTGLTPVEIINRHTHFAPGASWRVANSSSVYNSTLETEESSATDSHLVGTASGGTVGLTGASQTLSPMSATAAGTLAGAGLLPYRPPSTVSGISGREAAHLRQISGDTVSSGEVDGENTGATPSVQVDPAGTQADLTTPVSPPTTGLESGDGRGDYLTAAPTPPVRRSVFRESEEDMGHHT